MTGTSWHTTTISSGDDTKRHKSRCIHYSNNYCGYYFEKCRGSAHCEKYSEENNKVEIGRLVINEVEVYQGVKDIPIELISIDSNLATNPPKKTVLDRIKKNYMQNGVLDRPIVVEARGTKYKLIDNYPVLYFAKSIDLKVIPALYSLDNILGIKIRSKELLWNNKFKDNGEIIEIGYSNIKIKYDSGAVLEYPNNKPLGEEFRIVY